MEKNNMTTLGNVSVRIYDLSKHCIDQLIPVKDLSFESLETIRISDEPHLMSNFARINIAYRLGIPIQYLESYPPEVQASYLNNWIRKEAIDRLLLRFDRKRVRAIFRPPHRPLDNFEIIQRLNSIGYDSETYVQVFLDPEFMCINIPHGKDTFTVLGDNIVPGMSIANSEVGTSPLLISPFLLRLICSNGTVLKTYASAFCREFSLKIFQEFKELDQLLRASLLMSANQFRFSASIRLQNPTKAMKAFKSQFQLDTLQTEAAEWAWSLEKGETMFNLINTFTRAAQFSLLSARQSFEFQKIAGTILTLVKKEA